MRTIFDDPDELDPFVEEYLTKFSPKKVDTQISDPITFIDLFAGIGGFRLALDSLGCKCTWSCEIDPHAQQTYLLNHGDRPHGDIYSIPVSQIPNHDILCAGFPCQAFSSGGKRFGFSESRGILFFHVADIIAHHRPACVFLENVRGLLSHEGGETFQVILKVLRSLGYLVYYKVIDAYPWVPQHRRRVYIIGFREPLNFSFPDPPNQSPVLGDILLDQVDPKYTLTDGLWEYRQRRAKTPPHFWGFGLFGPEDVSYTLSKRYYIDGHEIYIRQDGKNPRMLSPRECARLMGYPDSFKFIYTELFGNPKLEDETYKQFGNSVVPPVIRSIGAQILKSLKGSE